MKIKYDDNLMSEIYDLNIDVNGKNIEINGMRTFYVNSHYKSNEYIFTLSESFLSTSKTDNENYYQLIEPFNIKKIFSAEQTSNY